MLLQLFITSFTLQCVEEFFHTLPLGAILGLQMKYLTEIEIRTLINMGKTLEIFLGRTAYNNGIINWISLKKNKTGQVELSTHSVF